ncbi:protein phosphatase 2C 34 [Pyrus ussuriensis x Pyrus communis]|uniref:Protein phosphatase 2C 34 n=1 Tax=Pyrus ussuriensis x Pyrus communis TaxID=2448454 RepID=A0A5N5HEL6_9ROSA|nr:protein phosphatase 2C 34 [Pyrus ussuriensis x Pyrus communis]
MDSHRSPISVPQGLRRDPVGLPAFQQLRQVSSFLASEIFWSNFAGVDIKILLNLQPGKSGIGIAK